MSEALVLTNPEKESATYDIGDVVSLIEGISSNPDNNWLLISPVRDSPDGLIADAITLDTEGNASSGPGTIHLIDIDKRIANRKNQADIVSAFKQLLKTTGSPLASTDYVEESIGKYYEK